MSKMDSTPQVNEICRISKSTVLTGDIVSSSDIRVDGILNGNIYTKGKLVVGEDAVIKGKLASANCDIWGKVDGDIYSLECATLKASATVKGVIKSGKLCIELGSIFNGSCNIIPKTEFDKLTKEMHPDIKESQPAADVKTA